MFCELAKYNSKLMDLNIFLRAYLVKSRDSVRIAFRRSYGVGEPVFEIQGT